jgi:MHS family alpha-ketoglutarate permease-like MFS transporter
MRHWRPLVAAIFVVGGVQVLNYSWTTGLPNLANATYKENPDAVFGITTLFNVLMVAAGPAVGALADRFGPGKVYSIVRLIGIPTMFLLVVYSRPSIATFITVMLVGGVVVSANMGLYNFIATSIIPRSCRTTGVGIGYALGVSLFGGTASYLLVFANSVHGIWIFSLYAAVIIGLSVVLYRAVMRRQTRTARAEETGPSDALGAEGLPSPLAWTNPGADEDPAHRAR